MAPDEVLPHEADAYLEQLERLAELFGRRSGAGHAFESRAADIPAKPPERAMCGLHAFDGGAREIYYVSKKIMSFA